ncbi:MAG: U32 family peptidase [Proteobacteria bacterium]|nr:U32 family peptidase [Pseudomonadota bacterium]MBU1639170.1 U32 family peptidase [Pseudomonadota bacterium]
MFSPTELLAPAGSLEKLKTAIHYGADAVYLGGKAFGLRAKAVNFDSDELAEAVHFAHNRDVRVFVTVNIMAHNRDLAVLPAYLQELADLKVDALIISDPGIFRMARKIVPQMKIHISTQANITNKESALFWQDMGASRVNLARELSLTEIREVKEALAAKVEVFVHGALCISYSGRCMLSHYLTGRDANKGACAHPCRYNYRLEEEKRPGEYFPVVEDERGVYIFNSKDLCLINRLPELLAAGVDSIKLEGRMKGIYYAGGIVRIYRAALDYIAAAQAADPAAEVVMPEEFMTEVLKLGSRGYSENFFDGSVDAANMLYTGPKVTQDYVPAAIIAKEGTPVLMDVRNVIRPGDELEYMGPGLKNRVFTVKDVRTLDDSPLEQANPGLTVKVFTDKEIAWQQYGLVRRVR